MGVLTLSALSTGVSILSALYMNGCVDIVSTKYGCVDIVSTTLWPCTVYNDLEKRPKNVSSSVRTSFLYYSALSDI